MATTLQTDYNALRKFSRELDRFSEELLYQVNSLQRETDSIVAYSWKGEQADKFAGVIADNSSIIKANIEKLRELSEKVKEASEKLREAREKDVTRR